MYEDIMRRPMFQNAQQRASSGIMTGVAPVQGFDRGGSVEWADHDYTPKFLREEQGILGRARKEYEGLNEEYDSYLPDIDFDNFFSTEQTEPGSGLNARDITDLLIVDPNNELDVALAGASAGLMASGLGAPAAVALTAARLGIKGKKLYKFLDKAQEVGEKYIKPTKNKSFRNPLGELEEAPGVVSRITAPIASYASTRAPSRLPDEIEQFPGVAESISGLVEDVVDIGPERRSELWEDAKEGIMTIPGAVAHEAARFGEDVYDSARTTLGMADGGITSLPVYMGKGGFSITGSIKDVVDWVRNKIKKGEMDEVEAQEIIDEVISKPNYENFERPTVTRREAAQNRADARRKEAEAEAEAGTEIETESPSQETIGPSKETKEDLTGTRETETTKPDPETEVVDEVFDEKGGKGWIRRNPIKSGIAGVVTAPITVPGTLGVVDEFAGTDMATPVREAMPTVGDIAESVSEVGGRAVTGFRKGLGSEEIEEESVELPQNPGIDYAELTKPPAKPVTTKPNLDALSGSAQEERSKVMPNFRPFGGKIAKALLGEDEAFGGDDEGDRGFLGSVMSKLQDPKMRYQLSQAAKATEGAVPRNFATDMEEAGQAYDDMVAQREYLSAQTRDVDRTDTEKLVDYYIDSLKEADPDMSNEEASKFRLELNSLFQKQNLDSAQMQTILTIFENVPNAATAQSIFDKLNIDPSVTTAIANILRGRGQV